MPTPDLATRFRALHAPGELLVLPNAWDAGSARLIESLGARAIATTSSGVCWARGYPDGKALPFDVLISAVAEITRVSTLTASVLPTGLTCSSWSTRSSFTCSRMGMSPISSSKSVPP